MLKTKRNQIDQEDLSRIELKGVSTLAIKVPTSGGFMTILRRGRNLSQLLWWKAPNI